MKKALITGITGQDGSYLAELLIAKGYEVHGIVRRVAFNDPAAKFRRVNWMAIHKINIHECDMLNYASVFLIVEKVRPDECYHLAAQSFVGSKDEFTTMANINMTHYILAAIQALMPKCRFYFAASSEMFGGMPGTAPQNENTPFHPRSIYAISKVAGFNLAQHYREAHNLFACSGILFNHESPRRGLEFVTRKITYSAAKIKLKKQSSLPLGNLSAKRDWGYAFNYVEAMWLMLQQDKPDDYVIATGETHTVQEFVELAFQVAGLGNWQKFVTTNEKFYRPTEVKELCGDYSKAKRILGWEPKVRFPELVKMMVESDLALYKKQSKVKFY